MPTWGSPCNYAAEARWRQCLNRAGQAMIAEGWKPYANKFAAVREKRARRLLREG